MRCADKNIYFVLFLFIRDQQYTQTLKYDTLTKQHVVYLVLCKKSWLQHRNLLNYHHYLLSNTSMPM